MPEIINLKKVMDAFRKDLSKFSKSDINVLSKYFNVPTSLTYFEKLSTLAYLVSTQCLKGRMHPGCTKEDYLIDHDTMKQILLDVGVTHEPHKMRWNQTIAAFKKAWKYPVDVFCKVWHIETFELVNWILHVNKHYIWRVDRKVKDFLTRSYNNFTKKESNPKCISPSLGLTFDDLPTEIVEPPNVKEYTTTEAIDRIVASQCGLLIFVDGDNMFHILRQIKGYSPARGDEDGKWNVHVCFVYRKDTLPSYFHITGIDTFSWLTIVPTETTMADAADNTISFIAGSINCKIKPTSLFYIVTDDHFAIHLVDLLRRFGRKATHIKRKTKNELVNILNYYEASSFQM